MSGLRLAALLIALGMGGAQADPLRIAVISDLNGSYGSTGYGAAVSDAVAEIIARRPDLVISTGDMIAGQRGSPKFTAAELGTMWAAFHATVSDRLEAAGIPFLVTAGNHDASAYPGFEAERAAYAAAWDDRRPGMTLIDDTDWPFRVAAEQDGVLLIGLDATRSGPLASGDMHWLTALLESEAGRHRNVILFGHLPLMPISQGREKDVLADSALFDLARGAGVDLWLSGHHHAFYSGTAGGILFVAQGALGDGPRKLIGEVETSPKAFTWIEIGDDGAIRVSAFSAPGFGASVAGDSLPPRLGDAPFGLTRQMTRPN
jgi:3',5'-cyclic AMP phosphodiesterase CpdA